MTRKQVLDLVERAAWTFAQAALAVLLLDPARMADKQVLHAAAIAGLAAVLSLVKNIAKQRLAG